MDFASFLVSSNEINSFVFIIPVACFKVFLGPINILAIHVIGQLPNLFGLGRKTLISSEVQMLGEMWLIVPGFHAVWNREEKLHPCHALLYWILSSVKECNWLIIFFIKIKRVVVAENTISLSTVYLSPSLTLNKQVEEIIEHPLHAE